LEALVLDLVLRRELLPGGLSWLDDIDAERFVLYGMGAGHAPPAWLDASHFTFGYHKFLFGYLAKCGVSPEEALTTDGLISLVLLHERGDHVFAAFPTYAERRKALGPMRAGAIDDIAAVGRRDHPMLFSEACKRVRDLAVKRRTHHRVQRLLVLLETPQPATKDLWAELNGIAELLRALTGTDCNGR
jgi:hypothetical protein